MTPVFPAPPTFWTSSLLTADIITALRPEADGTTLLITVGNPLRADDGVGPYIAERFKEGQKGLILLDAGEKPENIIDKAVAAAPKKVVILDAADFSGKTGEARIIAGEHIPDTTLSTHTFPLKVIARMLKEDTGARVLFLGIQPKSAELGGKMCDEVKMTADEVIKIINGEGSNA